MPAFCRQRVLALGSLLAIAVHAVAQLPTVSNGMTIGEGTLTNSEYATPTGPYATSATVASFKADAASSSSTSNNSTVTSTGTSDTSTSSQTVTLLTGAATTTTQSIVGNATETTSTASATVTNTRPCNNYPELCNRKYSNITEVGCHNSPFVRPNNVASNQNLDVTTQLDDGVRFLQAQIQWPSNDTVPHFCHTSCDILDAGPITDWLGKVKGWVDKHPYDVVTILLGNGNYSKVDLYAPYIESTGIVPYIYQPPKNPMYLNDWPTLGEMILNGKRVVMWIDYVANQTAYPWLLDEFVQMWETPFDPVDASFPCDPQRPPNLPNDQAKNRLYIANHNLNVEVTAFGASILVPATSLLNTTNNITGHGSLGLAANSCVADWGRPPNFLNVDYYNYGGHPGSVFEVQAQMNNVTYTRTCCGGSASGANAETVSWAFVLGMTVVVSLLMS